MGKITLRSYAKVNLTLEVLGRREDGFHEIDSVVQVIGLSDGLVVEEAPAGVIELSVVDAPGVPAGPENSVYRACAAFFEKTGLESGARVRLTKRIPFEAGLGGGSGNAAAAIVALDRLYGCGLTRAQMAEIAAVAGSDSALFVHGGTVRMHGRGDVVEPLPDAPALDLVVAKPSAGISTSWAYAELDRLGSFSSGAFTDEAERAVKAGDRAALLSCMHNDFEELVYRAKPDARAAGDALRGAGAQRVLLCGSGAAVFGVFGSATEAAAAVDAIGEAFPFVAATRTLTREQSIGLTDIA